MAASGGMRTVRLPGSGLETSAVGFGSAGLFREPSRTRRQRLLELAFESGIRHFDVAPMYGLGRAEAELGRFARDRRDRLVIATKFGIAPTPVARLIARGQAPLQRMLESSPGVRGRARPEGADPRAGFVGKLLYRGAYDARAARVSLEQSLRALSTDRVDVFLVHDPAHGEQISDDLRGYLESARAAGLVGTWGVGGEPAAVAAAAARLGPEIPVVQIRDDVLLRSGRRLQPTPRQATVRFGVIARVLPRLMAHLGSDESILRRWSDATGADCANVDVVVSLLIRDALIESPRGPVLISTIRPDRIGTAVDAGEAAGRDDLAVEAFRSLVAAELGPRPDRP
jgi:D-threo-aldose 1-dehydrogenase